MAKEHDGVIGGDDLAQIRSYSAYARAQAQAIHKTIAATNGIDDVAAIKEEATETAQTFARVSIYADQRIGEILRELPTRQGKRTDTTSPTAVNEVTKTEALHEAGISKGMVFNLEAMASNPEVVQAVLDKAEAEGRIPSRKQVLDAINERKQRERELDAARQSLADAYHANEAMEAQVASLKKQVAQKPKPEVIEREVVREVVPSDYESAKRRASDLKRDNERLNREYQEIWHKKQEVDRRLEQANELLGEASRTHDAQRDIEQLTMATNSYLRNYGGKAWAFDQFYRVDEVTQKEFEKAINSLAAFAQNLSQLIKGE